MQWLALLASNLSSPGITLGFDFLLLTKKLQVGQLVGWSVFFHG
jgi:hypothetical protein